MRHPASRRRCFAPLMAIVVLGVIDLPESARGPRPSGSRHTPRPAARHPYIYRYTPRPIRDPGSEADLVGPGGEGASDKRFPQPRPGGCAQSVDKCDYRSLSNLAVACENRHAGGPANYRDLARAQNSVSPHLARHQYAVSSGSLATIESSFASVSEDRGQSPIVGARTFSYRLGRDVNQSHPDHYEIETCLYRPNSCVGVHSQHA